MTSHHRLKSLLMFGAAGGAGLIDADHDGEVFTLGAAGAIET